MGWTLYKIDSLPDPNDIVWCKFPHAEKRGQPGPVARPCLVRAVSVLENPETGTLFGVVEVSYGTGTFTEELCKDDLIIKDRQAVRRCGLHKPTRFALDQRNRKTLIWCEEFFLANDYVRDADAIVGSLGEAEIEQMEQKLKLRGLLVK